MSLKLLGICVGNMPEVGIRILSSRDSTMLKEEEITYVMWG